MARVHTFTFEDGFCFIPRPRRFNLVLTQEGPANKAVNVKLVHFTPSLVQYRQRAMERNAVSQSVYEEVLPGEHVASLLHLIAGKMVFDIRFVYPGLDVYNLLPIIIRHGGAVNLICSTTITFIFVALHITTSIVHKVHCALLTYRSISKISWG